MQVYARSSASSGVYYWGSMSPGYVAASTKWHSAPAAQVTVCALVVLALLVMCVLLWRGSTKLHCTPQHVLPWAWAIVACCREDGCASATGSEPSGATVANPAHSDSAPQANPGVNTAMQLAAIGAGAASALKHSPLAMTGTFTSTGISSFPSSVIRLLLHDLHLYCLARLAGAPWLHFYSVCGAHVQG